MGTAGRTQHQWTAPAPQSKTGGPNWQAPITAKTTLVPLESRDLFGTKRMFMNGASFSLPQLSDTFNIITLN